LNGKRFEVAMLQLEYDVMSFRRRRRRVPGLPEVRLVGRVFAPPQRYLLKLFGDSATPVKVRYRGLSGLFYFDATIGHAIMFTAVAAGPVTVKP